LFKELAKGIGNCQQNAIHQTSDQMSTVARHRFRTQ